MNSENETQTVNISIDSDTMDSLRWEISQHARYIGDMIREGTATSESANALVEIAQGLSDVAAAIRMHTEYLKDRSYD